MIIKHFERTSSKSSGVMTFGGGVGIAGPAATIGTDEGPATGAFEREGFARS
jgi:hypothetical protein